MRRSPAESISGSQTVKTHSWRAPTGSRLEARSRWLLWRMATRARSACTRLRSSRGCWLGSLSHVHPLLPYPSSAGHIIQSCQFWGSLPAALSSARNSGFRQRRLMRFRCRDRTMAASLSDRPSVLGMGRQSGSGIEVLRRRPTTDALRPQAFSVCGAQQVPDVLDRVFIDLH